MRRKNKKKVLSAVRDPERTRARILAAAFAEFAARGFAGARVDAIARRARSNKRMLYHYFTNKEGLFRAVMKWKTATRRASEPAQALDFISGLPVWFGQNCADAAWIRILAWESLQTPTGPVPEKNLRHDFVRRYLKRIRAEQAAGVLNPDFSPQHLMLAMTALTMLPLSLGQLTWFITGKRPGDPKFQREYSAFLKQLAPVFGPLAKSK